MKVYYVNSIYYELHVFLYNDHSDKKGKEAYMSVLFCASLAAYIPNVTFSRISLTPSNSKSSQRGARMTEWDYCPPLPPVYTPVEFVL